MTAPRRKKRSGDAGVLSSVATHANVSAGTVSRVFNNSDLISGDTRSRVIEAARELGFRPRVKVRNPQIALVTEPPWKTVMGGYVNSMTQFICHALSRADADISMITEDRIDRLAGSWFDGIIGIAWDERTIAMLKEMRNVPIVWLSDNWSDHFDTVYVDADATGRLAGDYLLERGHRRIAVIHESDYTGTKRAQGVANAIRDAGGDPDADLLTIRNSTPLNQAVQVLLGAGCTALWVTGEDMAVLEVNWILQELAGKRVPQDLSLMGFENPGISEFLRPSLTTIASPLREMAEEAVKVVLNGRSGPLRKVRMNARLVERNSVRSL